MMLAEAYEKAMASTPTLVSMAYYGNGTFMRDFKKRARSVSVDKYGEMLAEFAINWPKGTPWPDLRPMYFTRQNLIQQRYKVRHVKQR